MILIPSSQQRFIEVEKKLASSVEKDTHLSRSSARKSRLTDSFFDAKERLEDAREATHSSPSTTQLPNRTRAYLKPALDPENTVIVYPNDDAVPMGIEVTGVQDDPASTSGRLSAVQILRIEPDGRVGMDGRLRVGDNIVEIDSRPVYQMSIVRARAYLSELQSRTEPSLTVARPASTFADADQLLRNQPTTSSLHNRPILSALQQANTVHIGHTKVVDLRKTPAGFGFTVTGRETAKGERLFYIGTVKPNGVALGHLRAGDRLLELNGEPTADLTQAEVVDRLKKANVGETVSFLVSRVVDDDDEKKSNSSERENRPPTPVGSVANRGAGSDKATTSTSTPSSQMQTAPKADELELVIPLNDTGSAGLGVSLKARVTVRTNGTRQDCGIFIKNVLHGGAAHKDGRLRVNDRIIGIEELRLDGESNATASEAVSRRLKAIGPTAKHVRWVLDCSEDHFSRGSRLV
ncbi:unnamed protein product [Heligmosomoides polygyrus]|uniref:PDZ domain-containing protein n=1 Tax=Heligmosomoides polygyrus TaxID=6339 RepID=A0A183GE31_HELPZ|nr:unnamed protein product [Heligmosomoides polygyrus]